MKTNLFVLTVLLGIVCGFSGCVGPKRNVTLISKSNDIFTGKLKYNVDMLSGELTISPGPDGENFTGDYTVIDRTSYSRSHGMGLFGDGGIGASSFSSGEFNAIGKWIGIGDRGSKMIGEIQIGHAGHGTGTVKHSSGQEYEIMF